MHAQPVLEQANPTEEPINRRAHRMKDPIEIKEEMARHGS
jgi:hypothetical protein